MNLDHIKLAATCDSGSTFPPNWYDGLTRSGTDCTIQLQSADQILLIVGNLIRILTVLAGALAVIFIVVGGVFYIVSQGDPAKIKRAKEIIIQSVTGLVVVLVAYNVVTFIAGRF